MLDARARSFAVLIVLLLFGTVATAQHDTAWVRRVYGTGNGDDRVVALAAGPTGDIYAVVQNLPDDTSSTIITARYSSDGTLLWSRRFGVGKHVVPVDIAVDADGNALVVGTSEIPMPDSIVTIKYSSSGDSCWARYYNTEGNNDMAADVLVDGAGNVYVAGTSETDNDYEDMLLVKYSSSGEELWARLFDFQENEDFGLALVMDRQGYIYEAGAVLNWQGGGHFDLSVLKYSPDGVLQWARIFSGPGMNEDSAVALAVDPQNNLVVAGCSHPNSDSSGFLVVKYSPSGDTLWSRCLIGDRDENGAVGVGTDSLGNVVFAGNFDRAYLVVKYSPSGTELWRQTYNGPRDHDSLAALVVEPGGNVCVTGWAGRDAGDDDAVTVMYSPAGDSLWAQRWVTHDSLSGGGLALVKAGDRYCVGGTYERKRHYDANLICYDRQGAQLWQANVNGPGANGAGSASAVEFDRDGNVLLAGWVENMDADMDLAVAKFSRGGDLLWLETWGGIVDGEDAAVAMAVDSVGYVYVAGYTETEDAGFDYVTARYTPTGVLDWLSTYNGPADSADVPTCLALDGSGGVIVSGKSAGIGTNIDFATVHYAATGRETWSARYNGAYNYMDIVGAVATDGAGTTYICGRSYEEGEQVYATVVRYDETGTGVWLTRVEDPDSARTSFRPVGLALGPSGDLFMSGYGNRAFLAARLDTTGDTVWTSRADASGSCRAYAATTDRSGRTYVAGRELGSHGYDYLTVCIGPSGEELWRRATDLGGEARAVAPSPAGHITVTGEAGSYFVLTIVYDSLGATLWADTLMWFSTGVDLAYGVDGRLAVAFEGLGASKMATVVYEPRIGIAEAPERTRPAHPAATLTRGRLRAAEPGRLYDTSGRQVCLLRRGENDVRHLAPGVYTVHTVTGALSRVVKVR